MPKETEVNVYRKIPVKVRAIKWDGTNAIEKYLISNCCTFEGKNRFKDVQNENN